MFQEALGTHPVVLNLWDTQHLPHTPQVAGKLYYRYCWIHDYLKAMCEYI